MMANCFDGTVNNGHAGAGHPSGMASWCGALLHDAPAQTHVQRRVPMLSLRAAASLRFLLTGEVTLTVPGKHALLLGCSSQGWPLMPCRCSLPSHRIRRIMQLCNEPGP